MQCQGFVGKPIIESELLAALESALQIEWVRDNTPQSLSGTQLAPAEVAMEGPKPENLPDLLREELARLARQGHATALRETLRTALTAHPEHTVTLHFLQGLAERFVFQALCLHLREPEPEYADPAQP